MGIGDGLDAIREHLTRTNYSTYLVSWARLGGEELWSHGDVRHHTHAPWLGFRTLVNTSATSGSRIPLIELVFVVNAHVSLCVSLSLSFILSLSLSLSIYVSI